MRLSPLQRKEIAEKLLAWLKENNINSCNNTYSVMHEASDKLNEPMYDIWKGFYLLRTMGRIELNNPNGKYGFHVIDSTPLSVYQLRTDNFKRQIQKEMLLKIMVNLKKQYKDIWNECLEDVREEK